MWGLERGWLKGCQTVSNQLDGAGDEMLSLLLVCY